MHDVSSILSALRRLAAARPEARRFAARAWLGAPLVQASLATAGLEYTLRLVAWVGRSPARPSRRRSRHVESHLERPVEPEEGAALVAAVFRHHIVRGACLPQALLQVALHRRDGVPARLVIGVRRPLGEGVTRSRSLAAHAWVEPEQGEQAASSPTFAPIFIDRMAEGSRA
jgi:transglutaminase-like putative cysteine protease